MKEGYSTSSFSLSFFFLERRKKREEEGKENRRFFWSISIFYFLLFYYLFINLFINLFCKEKKCLTEDYSTSYLFLKNEEKRKKNRWFSNLFKFIIISFSYLFIYSVCSNEGYSSHFLKNKEKRRKRKSQFFIYLFQHFFRWVTYFEKCLTEGYSKKLFF